MRHVKHTVLAAHWRACQPSFRDTPPVTLIIGCPLLSCRGSTVPARSLFTSQLSLQNLLWIEGKIDARYKRCPGDARSRTDYARIEDCAIFCVFVMGTNCLDNLSKERTDCRKMICFCDKIIRLSAGRSRQSKQDGEGIDTMSTQC
jgi:hypothetical protein